MTSAASLGVTSPLTTLSSESNVSDTFVLAPNAGTLVESRPRENRVVSADFTSDVEPPGGVTLSRPKGFSFLRVRTIAEAASAAASITPPAL